jgi:hypothetical protein
MSTDTHHLALLGRLLNLHDQLLLLILQILSLTLYLANRLVKCTLVLPQKLCDTKPRKTS